LEPGLHDRLGLDGDQVDLRLRLHHGNGDILDHALVAWLRWCEHAGVLLTGMASLGRLARQRERHDRGRKPPRPNTHGCRSPRWARSDESREVNSCRALLGKTHEAYNTNKSSKPDLEERRHERATGSD